MPLLIKGKVLDDQGLPLLQTVDIKEVSVIPGATAIADVWADDDGSFSLLALSDTSIIEVSSYGWTTQHFPAKSVPAEIRLVPDPALTITGATTKKPAWDDEWMYVFGGALIIVAAFALFGSEKPKQKASASKGLSLPARKPKTVIEF